MAEIYPNMASLKGKVVLVTAGSAGLGASIVRKFALEGASVALNFNSSAQKAIDLSTELKDLCGAKVLPIQADATTSEGIKKLVDFTVAELGQLDVVVSNVGWTRVVDFKKLDELDDELWDGCFNANIKSHFKLYNYSRRYLDQSVDGGSFIVTASVAGRIVYGSSIPYAVSKAGLVHLVKCLAKNGTIRVHAVCPGLLMTDWGKKFPQEKITNTKNLSPLKKLADVDETASHYTFLSKLTSSTGTIIGIDAGIML